MMVRCLSLLASTSIAILVMASSTEAATLWRGTMVVTARSGTADCISEYDVGEDFILEYRPNLGAPVDETMTAIGPHGAQFVTSTDTVDRTLRTGSVSILGASYARGFSAITASQPLTITPNPVVSTTPTISISGVFRNAGILGCSITFRASLLPIFDGPQ